MEGVGAVKKIALTLVLLALMGQAAFAADNTDFQSKIDIISPALGTEANVILSNDLYISIRINEPVDSLIKVVKVEEYSIDMSILDKVFMNIELTEDEKDQIYNANIARNYFRLKDELQSTLIRLNEASQFEEEGDDSIHELELSYQSLLQQYTFYEEMYRNIFYQTVLEAEPLVYEGVLPYYERTIPIRESGDYKMIFQEPDEQVIMEVDFEMKSKDSVAQEIIDNIPLRLIRMIDYME